MKPLIAHGHLYIAQPSLYNFSYGRQSYYAYSECYGIMTQLNGRRNIIQAHALEVQNLDV